MNKKLTAQQYVGTFNENNSHPIAPDFEDVTLSKCKHEFGTSYLLAKQGKTASFHLLDVETAMEVLTYMHEAHISGFTGHFNKMIDGLIEGAA